MDPAAIDGLVFAAQFLAVDEEASLLQRLAGLDYAPFQFQQWQGKRRVAWFGYRYDYEAAGLLAAPPLPADLVPLRDRAAALAGVATQALVQTLITEYPAGAGIGWHRDRPVFDVVVGISLGSDCDLRLRQRQGEGFVRARLHLPRRSAYVLRDAARQLWEHSIAPLPAPRYSITFRSLRPPARRANAARAAPVQGS